MATNTAGKTTLDPEGNYLTFINTFTVAPERADELLEALRSSTEEIFQTQPGFLSVNLHMSLDRTRIVNYAQWRSKQDYMAAFHRPEIQQHMKSIAALAISFDPVDYTLRYCIAHSAETA